MSYDDVAGMSGTWRERGALRHETKGQALGTVVWVKPTNGNRVTWDAELVSLTDPS